MKYTRLAVVSIVTLMALSGCGKCPFSGGACSAETARAEVTEEQVIHVVEGNSAFALDLFNELRETEGNLFFSPYSISSALGMTYAGARSNTEAEMKKTLHFPGDRDELCGSFGALQNELNSVQEEGHVKLSIANAIWAQKNYHFLPEFLTLVEGEYKSKISLADFATDAEKERVKINTWVEQQTNDKIKNLIPERVLDALTRMVLVNAIYFKGDWASQFKEEATREREFSVTAEKKVNVQMMYQKEKFRLAENDDTQMLELPYKGERLSMLALLPKERNKISALEETLTLEKLDSLIDSLTETEVEVSFPKFKIEAGYELVTPLKKLGMNDAFSDASDFSGMDGTKNLYISAILHKAFVEVDEKGTEAAAATAVVMKVRSIVMYPQFVADHPFLFLIRDNDTGSILFMGRMSDPSS